MAENMICDARSAPGNIRPSTRICYRYEFVVRSSNVQWSSHPVDLELQRFNVLTSLNLERTGEIRYH
jgi:hypothetical protein